MITKLMLKRLVNKSVKCVICDKEFTAKDDIYRIDSLVQKTGKEVYFHNECLDGLCRGKRARKDG